MRHRPRDLGLYTKHEARIFATSKTRAERDCDNRYPRRRRTVHMTRVGMKSHPTPRRNVHDAARARARETRGTEAVARAASSTGGARRWFDHFALDSRPRVRYQASRKRARRAGFLERRVMV